MMTATLSFDSGGWPGRMRALFADPAELHAILQVEVEASVKTHLEKNYSPRVNKLGGDSTGYWKGVAESTTAASGADGVTITIRQKGLRLKYHGGIITASGRISEVTGKPIRMLSIPAHPAAHGRTIADLGGRAAFYRKGAGIFKFTTPGTPKDGDPLYYILRRSVTIKADPGILPPPGDILNGCMRALQAAVPGGSFSS